MCNPGQRGDTMADIEIVRFAKAGGPLTKRISLSPEGQVHSNGAACVMSHGQACRIRLDGLEAFAALIANLDPNEAIALGSLVARLPDQVEVVTKRKLTELNGHAVNIIARTSEHIHYTPDRPALVLIDIDTKGMPPEVAGRITEAGGYWAALMRVLPGMAEAARVTRASTSTGLYRVDTRERLNGSGGFHIYLLIRDGGDSERFLKTFHDRCWLHGFGWHMIGAGGQLLERSLVDRTVYAPERLVFEAAPNVVPPLAQDQSARAPVVDAGIILDTRAMCPQLSAVEQAELLKLRSRAAQDIAPESRTAREAFIKARAEQIVQRTGGSLGAALQVVRRWCRGVLTPLVVLPFDSEEFAGCTVGDVLADPDRFTGATLADPVEGVGYGICKAKVLRRQDGSPWIHSFAHGRTIYDLRHDAKSVEAAIETAPKNEASNIFVEHVLSAELEADEHQRLLDLACERSGTGKRPMAAKLKAARAEQTKQRARTERERKAAARTDPRVRLAAPLPDAELLPVARVIDEVLQAANLAEPPTRDLELWPVEVRAREPFRLHGMTTTDANPTE